MLSPYIYAGVEPKIRDAVRSGLLLRGLPDET